MDQSGLGKVEKLADGSDQVSFTRSSTHSIDEIWSCITEPDRLTGWFPGFRLEQKTGGAFEIWFDGKCEGPAHVTGMVSRYEPPQPSGNEGTREAVLECGSLRYVLTSAGTGCTILFTDILHFDNIRTRAEFCNSVLGGWHQFLDGLEAALDNLPFDRSQPEFDYAPIDVPGRD